MEGLALEAGFGIVKYFVGSLVQHLNDNKELIEHAKADVAKLNTDYDALQNYIEHTVKNRTISDDVITNTLIKEVRDVVYEAEDAVDSYILQVTKTKSQCFSGSIPREATAEVARVIQSVTTKIADIRGRFESRIDTAAHPTGDYELLGESEGPPANQSFAPIFQDKEEILKQLLTREAQKPKAIVITGTHDIGKTMLAAKMFYDERIKFDERIWIGVSNPTTRNIFLAILRQQNKLSENESERLKNDAVLSELVRDCLKGKKFLLVMDNVWKMDDRARLESAFQSSHNKSKVLITSNDEELAKLIVADESSIVKLEPLSIQDSWKMFEWRLPSCPTELKTLGLTIAKNSYGMPRAITDACNFLIRKDSATNEMSRRKKLWEDVSRGLITDFSEATGMGKPNTAIESNYNNLPYRLRACFLYLGLFKQHSEFSVSKLIRMWIAEGFVQPSDKATLEETARHYLDHLISKNLVIPVEYMPDGSLTKCTLNARLHQFCVSEGGKGKENFLQEFKKCLGDRAFNPSITGAEKNRRVCIHDDVSNFIRQFISITRDSLQIRVRSFVSHDDTDKLILGSGEISDILTVFKLLRVMDAKPMKFKKIHTRLCELAHLRFVTLSIHGKTLPAAVSRLRKIQTLIVHTEASQTLKIEADILAMDELRHFKTNASATLLETSKASRQNHSLQTLCGISPKSCTKGFFEKTPNLKKLGIRGELARLLGDKNGPLSGLTSVEKLKLVNRTKNPKYEGKLNLQRLQFPGNLMSLTLSATRLSWDDILNLGSLQRLKALKLKDNAFEGKEWKVHDGGFPNLETLHIESVDFTEWKSSSSHFPQLTFLTLSKCERLKEIPIDFSEIRALRKLYLRHGKPSAAESARNIKKKMNRTRTRQIGLDLSITPDEL